MELLVKNSLSKATFRRTARSVLLRWQVSSLSIIWPMFVVCFAAIAVIFWRLGQENLHDWDEAVYAQISKEMVKSGDWLTPSFGYEPWFDKPPLFMWITAFFYSWFGANEFWSRAGSAFSAVGVVILTFVIGRRLYNKYVGMIAALILLTSWQFVRFARFGMTDILLTLLTYLALQAYLWRDSSEQKSWYLIWTYCGIAIMVKSVVGLIAAGVIMLDVLVVRRTAQTLRSRPFWLGLLLAILIAGPWHAFMWMTHGRAFVVQYFGNTLGAHFTQVVEQHIGGRSFYLNVFQDEFFPWIYVLPFGLSHHLTRVFREGPSTLILSLLVAVVFGVFTLAQTKVAWYMMPIYPAAAVLIASVLVDASQSRGAVAFSELVVATCLVALFAPLKLTLGFACAAILLLAVCFAKGKLMYQLLAVIMCAFLFAVGINGLLPLYHAEAKPAATLARMAARTGTEHRGPIEPIIVFPSNGLRVQTVLFYSDRPVRVADSPGDLARLVDGSKTQEVILPKEMIATLASAYEISPLHEARALAYVTIRRIRNSGQQ